MDALCTLIPDATWILTMGTMGIVGVITWGVLVTFLGSFFRWE